MSPHQLCHGKGRLIDRLSLVEAIALPVWVFDIDHCRVFWANSNGLQLWDASSLDELRSRDMSADISPTVKARLEQYRQDFKVGHNATEVWTLYPNGRPKNIRCIFSGIHFDDGRLGMLNQCLELMDEKESTDTLRSVQALLHTSVMISLFDRDDQLLYSNPAARKAYKDAHNSFRDRLTSSADYTSVTTSVEVRGEAKCVARVKTKKGIRWHEIVARSGWDPVTGVPAVLVSETDVTSREEASFFADHDILTKLPNRRHLEREIIPLLASAADEARQLGLLFVDIDRFKTINDTLGHAVGDKLLIDVARRLQDCVQPGGLVARMGGDEFVIVLSNLADHADALKFAEHLSETLRQSIRINRCDFNITVSIGVSMYPQHGDSFEALLRYADMAMYSAKESGRNQTKVFTSALESRLRLKVDLESGIRRDRLDDEFFLLYQPRPKVADDQVASVEALLRWNHPTEGVLTADRFIPLAEESGLIETLDAWVLMTAAEQQLAWRQAGFDVSVSVNVSPQQFRSERFATILRHLAEADDYQTGSIELEITESVLMGNSDEVCTCLRDVKELGFNLAIDDFGTGYSNFAYLRDYPITSLKIDKSFMRDLYAGCIVEGMIAMCRFLGVNIVAEGIEEGRQLDWLKNQACDEYQGFYFCPPVQPHQIPEIIRSRALKNEAHADRAASVSRLDLKQNLLGRRVQAY